MLAVGTGGQSSSTEWLREQQQQQQQLCLWVASLVRNSRSALFLLPFGRVGFQTWAAPHGESCLGRVSCLEVH